MRKLLIPAAIVFVACLASCKKKENPLPCESCSSSGSASIRLCERDFGNSSSYQAAISTYEMYGYTCTASGTK